MTQEEYQAALEASWADIRRGLGAELGESLDHARRWIGDRAFLTLASKFGAGQVIVACGIDDADELLAGFPFPRPLHKGTKRDRRLRAAIKEAHLACGPHAPRSQQDRARAWVELERLLSDEG